MTRLNSVHTQPDSVIRTITAALLWINDAVHMTHYISKSFRISMQPDSTEQNITAVTQCKSISCKCTCAKYCGTDLHLTVQCRNYEGSTVHLKWHTSILYTHVYITLLNIIHPYFNCHLRFMFWKVLSIFCCPNVLISQLHINICK